MYHSITLGKKKRAIAIHNRVMQGNAIVIVLICNVKTGLYSVILFFFPLYVFLVKDN